MVEPLVVLGIALLLVPALGEIAKTKKDKGFLWLGVAGALYLLAAAFNAGFGATFTIAELGYGAALFSVIGLIFTLIGAVMLIMGLFK